MAGDDSELMAMVRHLSTMPASDRSFVLGALDERETRDLQRLLKPLGERAMSQALRSLASDCADGRRPAGITERAALAIAKASAAQALAGPIENPPLAPTSPWARLAVLLRGR
jgi:hypothetical protein